MTCSVRINQCDTCSCPRRRKRRKRRTVVKSVKRLSPTFQFKTIGNPTPIALQYYNPIGRMMQIGQPNDGFKANMGQNAGLAVESGLVLGRGRKPGPHIPGPMPEAQQTNVLGSHKGHLATEMELDFARGQGAEQAFLQTQRQVALAKVDGGTKNRSFTKALQGLSSIQGLRSNTMIHRANYFPVGRPLVSGDSQGTAMYSQVPEQYDTVPTAVRTPAYSQGSQEYEDVFQGKAESKY